MAKTKPQSKSFLNLFKTYLWIALGALLAAISIELFLYPNNLIGKKAESKLFYFKRRINSDSTDLVESVSTPPSSSVSPVSKEKVMKSLVSRSFNYFVKEPAVTLGTPIVKSFRYVLFVGMLTSLGFVATNPIATKNAVSKFIPKVTIEMPN